MKIFEKICYGLIIIGAINWGLVGIFKFNLVDFLFKEGSVLSRIIYSLIGIIGLVSIVFLFMPDKEMES